MIKPEQIPDEVMAVFKDAWFNQGTLTTRECLAAAITLVRKATLEEAAKLMEERTARHRTIYALQNDIRNNVPPCEHAAAIRKLGEK